MHITPLSPAIATFIHYVVVQQYNDDILQSKRESISGVFIVSVQESYHLRACKWDSHS